MEIKIGEWLSYASNIIGSRNQRIEQEERMEKWKRNKILHKEVYKEEILCSLNGCLNFYYQFNLYPLPPKQRFSIPLVPIVFNAKINGEIHILNNYFKHTNIINSMDPIE